MKTHELIEKAQLVKDTYTSHGGIPTDTTAFNYVFPPPVCERADQRMAGVLEVTQRQGDYLYYKDKPFPFARLDTRSVLGLDRWVAKAPKRTQMQVMIKNPWGENDSGVNGFLGIKNVLVVYKKGAQAQALLGDIIKKSVYVIRPVFDLTVAEKILQLWKRHVDV